MRIFGFRDSGESGVWTADDEAALEAVLHTRDSRGGNWFDLCADDAQEVSYPLLTIRVGGELADICYTLRDDEPGYRCVGTVRDVEPNGWTVFKTAAGDEYIANEFLVPFSTALAVAKEFLRGPQLPTSVQWLEL
jgi:hypothetical protein